jgi:folylpolyglutamate synthase
VYDALQMKKNDEKDLPSYFQFLLIMSLYVFVRENVDVAIVEVGIGGQYDSTNIIRNTEIAAITALQLEHTNLLGNTLEEIAWQKSGIIKKNCDVYAMNQSDECCIKVIKDRSVELKAKSLSFIPQLDDYEWVNCSKPDFTHEVNKLNFSLAAQISSRWLRNRKRISESLFENNLLIAIEKQFIDAYQKCNFEGRFQKIDDNKITYYFDGAHTIESMKVCSQWFSKQLSNDEITILVFNVTGDRDSELIMKQLHSIKFDNVCFTTNIANDDLNVSDGKLHFFMLTNYITFQSSPFLNCNFRKLQWSFAKYAIRSLS